MTEQQAVGLRAVQRAGRWRLDGAGPADLPVINEFLGYVADRGYSPRTERAYAFDLLAFARWLVDQDLTVGGVTTDALLRFLTFCRAVAVLRPLDREALYLAGRMSMVGRREDFEAFDLAFDERTV